MKKYKCIAAGCAAAITAFAAAGCTPAESSTGDPEIPDSLAAVTTAAAVTTVSETTTPVTTTAAPQTTTVNAEDSSSEAEIIIDPLQELMDKLPDTELENKKVKRLAAAAITPADITELPSLDLFYKKYGGSLEETTVSAGELYNKLAQLLISGSAPDIVPADDTNLFPKGVLHELFQPVDELIDFSSELWNDTEGLSSFYTFRERIYAAGIEAVPEYVCIYNTKTIKENELPDPADIYAEGGWDYDAFTAMCRSFTDKEKDKYALDGYQLGAALTETCGVPLITMESGWVISNLEDDRLAEVQDRMYSLGQKGLCFDKASNDWLTRGSGKVGEGMAEGSTLFWTAGLWALSETEEQAARFGDISKGEVMFVPMPRSDSSQHYMSAQIRGCYICKDAPSPEGAAAYLNCLKAARSFDNEAEEKRLSERFGWDIRMLEMRRSCYELAREAPVIDCAEGMPKDEHENLFYDTLNAALLSGDSAKNWQQTLEAYRKQINYAVMTANDTEPMGP